MNQRRLSMLMLILVALFLFGCNNLTETTNALDISGENAEPLSDAKTNSNQNMETTTKSKTISHLHYFPVS